MENPFTLVPYVSKELFCDREKETDVCHQMTFMMER